MAAYCFDKAVGKFGRAVEGAVRKVEGKGKALAMKQEQMLRKWLDLPLQYRNPNRSGCLLWLMTSGLPVASLRCHTMGVGSNKHKPTLAT